MRSVLAIVIGAILSLRPSVLAVADDLHSTPPELACRQELLLLEVWRVQNVVRAWDYQHERRGSLNLYSYGWLKIHSNQQRAIALAAFCPIAVRFGAGDLTVNSGDEIMGSVINGVWHSRLAP